MTPSSPQEVADKVAEFTAAFKVAVSDRDEARARAESFERSNAILLGENESLERRLKEVEAKLGFYMRHSQEITTHLQNGLALFHDAMDKAKQGAFRPNGPGRVEAPSAPTDIKVPTFLTAPRDKEALASIERAISSEPKSI